MCAASAPVTQERSARRFENRIADADENERPHFSRPAGRVRSRVMLSIAANPRADLESTHCAVHPDVLAVAVCSRCGDYHCAKCNKQVANRALCARCRSLPGVDYLENTRLRFWGKRDSFTWYFGLVGVMTLASLPRVIRIGDLGHIAASFVWAGVSLAYLAQYRPMRLGLIVVSCIDILADGVRAALGLPLVPSDKALAPAVTTPMLVLGIVVGAFVAVGAYGSPRNKLAFKIPIGESELQRVYDRYVSNPLAVRAAVYGALCAFIPFASAITLIIGIRALRRVDSAAWPPRSGRLPARIGIVLSGLGLLFWAALALKFALRASH
jgi:hypothetical protein